jgi:hypothetical protein
VQGLPLLYAVVLVLVAAALVGTSTRASRRLRQPRSTVAVETGPVRPSAA